MGQGEKQRRRQFFAGDPEAAGSEARLQDAWKQQKHGGRGYVPSRNALSQSSTQKMLPISRAGSELTPNNIRQFNKQKEDEAKGMGALLNVQEAPKASSQTRSQADPWLKFKSAQRPGAAGLDGDGKEHGVAGRSYQKK